MDLIQKGAVRLIEANDISEGTVEYLRESAASAGATATRLRSARRT